MGKIMREVYYREPNVIVEGKYSRELSVEKLLQILKESKIVFGIGLKEVHVKYDKRKDGIIATRIFYKNGEPNYEFRHKPLYDKTVIFYTATKTEPAKKVVCSIETQEFPWDENGKEEK